MQSSSLLDLEPRIGKTWTILQDKTTVPHSIVQTVEEFGFGVIAIIVSQEVKLATTVDS